jgi:hypothetical protein
MAAISGAQGPAAQAMVDATKAAILSPSNGPTFACARRAIMCLPPVTERTSAAQKVCHDFFDLMIHLT